MPGILGPAGLAVKFCAVISSLTLRGSWCSDDCGASEIQGARMKIVSFQADGGWHLGAVEDDRVIDLNAVDNSLPGELGEFLRRSNGDFSALQAAAKRAG